MNSGEGMSWYRQPQSVRVFSTVVQAIANNLNHHQTNKITKPKTQQTMTPETTTKTKFGIYGGQFIPETLMPAIEELTTAGQVSGGQFRCNKV